MYMCNIYCVCTYVSISQIYFILPHVNYYVIYRWNLTTSTVQSAFALTTASNTDLLTVSICVGCIRICIYMCIGSLCVVYK